ncbi:hypothetical protein B0I72DRAFT_12509 [Yarrowia lipolytica]|uniref:YALI0B19448p n=2 Tax=Yarrowia lipolytica TaxID=4952 RepID=Q6CE15_YARLI|nr:YALI0B19448p [Yarrowia lipolytica CLIB122]AOW01939.1 hypothetical protein YALI1_B25484g [Yarrowia lipolytica]KAB8282486.1 hypothetical protein BKA91DRAFT_21630 [Yarrowia lipolytica]KAE8170816.1 hypothetical protein BKA90DRAFT_33781 [Yarrowia lipolytica]KAJ8052714.1 hypothetical protein LXG23DRAFT_52195 [Yarrowia lipolytica]RDW34691.1 hypothetical protein B0I72DRAFT_12509 [Yarrowia lipolytica]|eukprot:XP_501097.1 YALI0B19448p [Yarrowia lipolytica CLIB122]
MSYTISAAALYSATIYLLFLRDRSRQSLERSEILAAREATNYSISNTTIFSGVTAKSYGFNAHYRGVPATYWSWLLLVQGLFVLGMFYMDWPTVGYGALLVWSFYAYATEQCDKQGRMSGLKIQSMFGPVKTFAGRDKFHWYAVVNTGTSLDLLPESSDDELSEEEEEDVEMDGDVNMEETYRTLRQNMHSFEEIMGEGEEVVFEVDEPVEEDYGMDEFDIEGEDDEPKFEGFSPVLSPHDPSDSGEQEETRMLDEWDRESYAPSVGGRAMEEENSDEEDYMSPDTPGSIQLVLKRVNLPLPPVHHFQGYIGVYRHTRLKRSTVVHTCLDPMDYEAMETVVL